MPSAIRKPRDPKRPTNVTDIYLYIPQRTGDLGDCDWSEFDGLRMYEDSFNEQLILEKHDNLAAETTESSAAKERTQDEYDNNSGIHTHATDEHSYEGI